MFEEIKNFYEFYNISRQDINNMSLISLIKKYNINLFSVERYASYITDILDSDYIFTDPEKGQSYNVKVVVTGTTISISNTNNLKINLERHVDLSGNYSIETLDYKIHKGLSTKYLVSYKNKYSDNQYLKCEIRILFENKTSSATFKCEIHELSRFIKQGSIKVIKKKKIGPTETSINTFNINDL